MFSKVTFPILIVVVFLVLAPIPFFIPSVNLDSSWMLSLIEANSSGLKWGSHITFTFGPAHFLFTKGFQTNYDIISLIISCVWTIAGIIILKDYSKKSKSSLQTFLILSIVITLFTNPIIESNTLYGYPIREAIIQFIMYLGFLNLLESSTFIKLYSNLLFLSTSILIKANLGILGLFYLLIMIIKSFRMRSKLHCLHILAIYTSWPILLWLLLKQNIIDIIPYLYTGFTFVQYYSDTMSITKSSSEIYFSLILSFILFKNFIYQSRSSSFYKATGLAALLFFSYKSSFTRHDAHSYISAFSLILVSLLNLTRQKNLINILACLCCFLYFASIDLTISKFNNSLLANSLYQYQSLANRILFLKDIVISDGRKFREDYSNSLNQIRTEYELIDFTGITSTNSYFQAEIYGNRLDFTPIPSIQSYALISPYLIEKNLKWLSTSKIPNFLFSLKTIDNRYPGQELSTLLPFMINNYRLDKKIKDDLFLLSYSPFKVTKRKQTPIEKLKIHMGQWIDISHLNSILIAQITLSKSYFGYFTGLFYKRNILNLEVMLNDGRIFSHRYLPIDDTQFILSPYLGLEGGEHQIFTNYVNNQNIMDGIVIKFRLVETSEGGLMSSWKDTGEVQLFEFK